MGKVIYLHLENEIEREVTQDAIDAIEHDYIEIITEIETKKAQRARASGLFADGTKLHDLFEPTTGHHCNRCPFKSICPEWSHAYGDDESIDGQEL
jgi:CRISPR/Cas system-associated exonuclease Cas4 (RecB family)